MTESSGLMIAALVAVVAIVGMVVVVSDAPTGAAFSPSTTAEPWNEMEQLQRDCSPLEPMSLACQERWDTYHNKNA